MGDEFLEVGFLSQRVNAYAFLMGIARLLSIEIVPFYIPSAMIVSIAWSTEYVVKLGSLLI